MLMFKGLIHRLMLGRKSSQKVRSHGIQCRCRVCTAARLIRGGNRLLDVGCGDGFLALMVKGKSKEVYGVDITPEALAIAESRGMKTLKVNLNVDPLPFPRGFFDVITCLDVIEHILDPGHLIKEVNRILKMGGILVISTPNIRFWGHLLTLIVFGRFPRTSQKIEVYDGGHIHYFTYKDIEYLLKTFGFEIIRKCGVLDINFLKEFRSPGVMIKARKVKYTR